MKKLLSLLFFCNSIIALSETINTNTTLYYSNVQNGDDVNVDTNDRGKTAPLQGFGAYLNNREYILNTVTINTAGMQADAIRTNGGNNFFYANSLKIKAEGFSADAINMASNNNNTKHIDLLYVDNSAELISQSGVAVRANNYYNEDSKSIIILPDASIIKSTSTSTASNTSETAGYAIFSGNRNTDYNAGVYLNAKGRSYVFVGNNAQIESNAKKGHAVYANKGGLVQLGSDATIHANGNDAYALFASTEQQGTFTDNVRPGYIYLAGGATLRAENSLHVIQAKGKDSFIKNGYIDVPVVDDTYVRGTDITIDSDNYTKSSGKFDVIGNISAIEGGHISLNMANDSVFRGSASIDSDLDSKIELSISGDRSVWKIDKDSSLTSLHLSDGATLSPYKTSTNESTSFTIKGNILNERGIISLSEIYGGFDTFTIDGNYVGNDGYIIFDTELEDDNSQSDKLIITGNTSGNTNVVVNNIGGTGAETIEGIEIIKVNGSSDGIFSKAGRIVAGAYEYFLKKGDGIITDSKNWYLTSSLSSPPTPPGPTPTPPGPTPTPPGPTPTPPGPTPTPPGPTPTPPGPTPTPPGPTPTPPGPTPTPPAYDPVYRPEVGSYLSNSMAVNNLFVHGFHDRLGENQKFSKKYNREKNTDIWTRNVGNYSSFGDSSNQLKTSTNGYALQVGGNLLHWNHSDNNFLLGIMGGFGFNNSTTNSNRTSYISKGNVEGYSLGLYGSWYTNKDDRLNYYADTWITYSWFDNEVNGEKLKTEKYRSKGLTYSIEGGFDYQITKNMESKTKYYIQPKAQLIYMGVDTKDHVENNGTLVSVSGKGNIQSRVGAKFYMNKTHSTRKGVNKFQPFVEATWVHNTKDYSVSMDGVKTKQRGNKDLFEAKIGADINLQSDLNIYANVAQQWGKKGYKNTKLTVGIKYRF
ncbi:autotransporter outer membrane beta-barrel domain-containing protein [Fusobacterium sp. PH5-44]|uniref:autotransporter outer membrane beta-barrel domain-containing protein n=1 Tax=unclassified Fusobacterium TaxID=2648384 RepID=UPI003D21AD06